MQFRSASRLALSALVVVGCAAGCSTLNSGSPAESILSPTPTSVGSVRAGTLVDARAFPTQGTALAAIDALFTKIRYRSTSGADSSETVVSGVLVQPPGPPPAQGWPIVVFGHGTTGIRPECGPSATPTLTGSAEFAKSIVELGYVAALPDFEGLGEGSGHPYLNPITAGYNMIDAARAASAAIPGTSTDWIAYGTSQGGQAAWAANELDAEYAGESPLTLRGAVALSPATDLTGFATAAHEGTLTDQQKLVMPLVLGGIANSHPDMNIANYLHGVAADNNDALTQCLWTDPEGSGRIAESIGPLDYAPATPEALDRLTAWLEERSLPKTRTTAPMMVMYGGRDQTLLPEWTEKGIEKACALGDVIEVEEQSLQDHSVDPTPSIRFIAERLAGVPPVDSC